MKYYVSSGDYEEVLMAEDPMKAALGFLARVEEKAAGEEMEFGLIVHVSEIGFDVGKPGHDNDVFIATQYVFDEYDAQAKDDN